MARVLRIGLGALIVAGGVAAGCGGSGSWTASGGICARAIPKLEECGFTASAQALSSGAKCEEPTSKEEQCTANCFLNSDCGVLVEVYCNQNIDPAMECIDKCEPLPFTCSGGEQIKASDKCDGYEDCADGSDEAGCPTFECSGGETIPLEDRCDAYEDCADGSDEVNCTNLFDCGDGQKVVMDDKCDGYSDCDNSADEQGCPSNTNLLEAIQQDCASL